MFTEDFSVFFNPSEFAQTATLAGVSVSGIFDNGYASPGVGLSGMAGTQPTWLVPTSAVPAAIIDCLQNYTASFDPLGLVVRFSENGPAYKIVAHEPDGTGTSRLLLEVYA
jgi:hypothetical protein